MHWRPFINIGCTFFRRLEFCTDISAKINDICNQFLEATRIVLCHLTQSKNPMDFLYIYNKKMLKLKNISIALNETNFASMCKVKEGRKMTVQKEIQLRSEMDNK